MYLDKVLLPFEEFHWFVSCENSIVHFLFFHLFNFLMLLPAAHLIAICFHLQLYQ